MAKIFLIGMMGVGKSHWSEKWARKTNALHYDLDHCIEKMEGKSIPEIFAEKGEDYFRTLEAQTLRRFSEIEAFVMATGGGAACHHNNMDWMNQNGITIWLNEPLEILVGRLKHGKTNRPLIKDLTNEALHSFLQKKLAERAPYYAKSKYCLTGKEINNKSVEKILLENE